MTTYVGNAPSDQPQIVLTNKNYIINPTFSVNQRAFAGGAPYGYCFDRWKTSDVATTVTMPDANGFVTIALATGTVGLQHRPEDFGYSGNITISWEGTSELIFRDNGGSWSTATTSPAVINMATGLDATGAKALIVFQNGTLKNPKLEIGSSATPFEYPDTGTELLKCQRYAYKETAGFLMGQVIGATSCRASISFPVTMRGEAILEDFDLTGVKVITSASAEIAVTNLTANILGKNSARVRADVAGGLTSGDANGLRFGSGYVLFTAEL